MEVPPTALISQRFLATGACSRSGEQRSAGSSAGLSGLRRSIAGLMFLLRLLSGPAIAQDEPRVPFAGTDVISVRTDTGREELMGGSIQQISGERLTLRTNGQGTIRVISMADVSELLFHRSVAWEEGLKLRQNGKLQDAVLHFDAALDTEVRKWAWCELQAVAAATEIQRGRYQKALARIELILEKDSRSRHVSAIPLVWDARLPQAERVTAEAGDFHSNSVVRRLVAASALLHDETLRTGARRTLQQIRKTEGLSRIGLLADAQLWRLQLLEPPKEKNHLLHLWADRVRQLPPESRAGPQYVVARVFQQQHEYDQAALAFLWMPFMAPSDQGLTALSLVEAIHCLKLAGRRSEVVTLTAELKRRFPDASATREFFATEK